VHHGDPDAGDGLRASLVHGRDLLCAFLLHPGAEFIDADDHGIVLLCNLDGIANVVAMACVHNSKSHFFTSFSSSGQSGLLSQGST